MKKCFVFLFVLFGLMHSVAADWQEDVRSIDEQINMLDDERVKALGRANMLEDQAIQWQFMPEQFNETKQAYASADAYRREAAMIQAQIDRLNAKKQRILQQQGITQ